MLDPEGHKKKTAANREWSANYLREQRIDFLSLNKGAHLKILCANPIDFWPGTGLFTGEGLRGRGVYNLVKILKGRKPWKVYRD